MLSRLPAPLRGALTASILGLNTLVVALSLAPPALLKLLVPAKAVRRVCVRLMNGLASLWVGNNNAWIAAVRSAAVSAAAAARSCVATSERSTLP